MLWVAIGTETKSDSKVGGQQNFNGLDWTRLPVSRHVVSLL
jgi:hypothetical protein